MDPVANFDPNSLEQVVSGQKIGSVSPVLGSPNDSGENLRHLQDLRKLKAFGLSPGRNRFFVSNGAKKRSKNSQEREKSALEQFLTSRSGRVASLGSKSKKDSSQEPNKRTAKAINPMAFLNSTFSDTQRGSDPIFRTGPRKKHYEAQTETEIERQKCFEESHYNLKRQKRRIPELSQDDKLNQSLDFFHSKLRETFYRSLFAHEKLRNDMGTSEMDPQSQTGVSFVRDPKIPKPKNGKQRPQSTDFFWLAQNNNSKGKGGFPSNIDPEALEVFKKPGSFIKTEEKPRETSDAPILLTSPEPDQAEVLPSSTNVAFPASQEEINAALEEEKFDRVDLSPLLCAFEKIDKVCTEDKDEVAEKTVASLAKSVNQVLQSLQKFIKMRSWPSGRKDIENLSKWFKTQSDSALSRLENCSLSFEKYFSALGDQISIHSFTFRELMRQNRVMVAERGELMGFFWKSYTFAMNSLLEYTVGFLGKVDYYHQRHLKRISKEYEQRIEDINTKLANIAKDYQERLKVVEILIEQMKIDKKEAAKRKYQAQKINEELMKVKKNHETVDFELRIHRNFLDEVRALGDSTGHKAKNIQNILKEQVKDVSNTLRLLLFNRNLEKANDHKTISSIDEAGQKKQAAFHEGHSKQITKFLAMKKESEPVLIDLSENGSFIEVDKHTMEEIDFQVRTSVIQDKACDTFGLFYIENKESQVEKDLGFQIDQETSTNGLVERRQRRIQTLKGIDPEKSVQCTIIGARSKHVNIQTKWDARRFKPKPRGSARSLLQLVLNEGPFEMIQSPAQIQKEERSPRKPMEMSSDEEEEEKKEEAKVGRVVSEEEMDEKMKEERLKAEFMRECQKMLKKREDFNERLLKFARIMKKMIKEARKTKEELDKWNASPREVREAKILLRHKNYEMETLRKIMGRKLGLIGRPIESVDLFHGEKELNEIV